VLPTIIALTTRYWFWRIDYIKRLGPAYQPRLNAIDKERVTLVVPAAGLTISHIRDTDGRRLGDKIVLVHHLRGQAEETEDFIRTTALFSIVLTGLLVLNVGTYLQNQSAITPGATWYQQLSTDTIGLLSAIPAFYGAAIGNAAVVLSQAVTIHALRAQVRRYRGVLP